MNEVEALEAAKKDVYGFDYDSIEIQGLKTKNYKKGGSSGTYDSLQILYKDKPLFAPVFGVWSNRGAVESKFDKDKNGLTVILDPKRESDAITIKHYEAIYNEFKKQILAKKLLKGVNPLNIDTKFPSMLLYDTDEDGVLIPDTKVALYIIIDVKKSTQGISVGKKYAKEHEIRDLKMVVDSDVCLSHISAKTTTSTVVRYGKGFNVSIKGLAEAENRMKRKAEDVTNEEQIEFDEILAKRAKMAEEVSSCAVDESVNTEEKKT